MSLVPNRALEGAAGNQGYNLQRSLRFRSSASAYLTKSFGTTPTSQTKKTWSFWVKRGQLNSAASFNLFDAYDGSSTNNMIISFYNDQLRFDVGGSNPQGQYITAAVFRDPSAWYHVVISIDTTQATDSNRVKMYINGTQLSNWSTIAYPPLNQQIQFSQSGINSRICTTYGASGSFFDGYLAEVNFIDGQALTPSSFGQTDAVTGVWTPKKYTGTYGTNGFYLPFSDNTSATTLAYDKSGNGNNWTANNISTTAGATYDSMTDVPTLTSATAANFCTLNPLTTTTTALVPAQGNLYFGNNATYNSSVNGTIGVSSGKWYWEVQADSNYCMTGITALSYLPANIAPHQVGSQAKIYYASNGQKYDNGNNAIYGATWTTTDIIGVALDLDSGTLTFYKNNTSQGTAYTGLSGTYWPVIGSPNGVNAGYINFGQRPFSYTPPTGFKALNTFNLPDPTIKKPNQYMDATTYTGTGSSNAVVNAAGFQPDLVWLKNRNYGAGTNHVLVDSVRGTSVGLASNLTNADFSTTGNFSSINSNGFTVAGTTHDYNFSTDTFVGWQWKKGATPGFDIVTYTGNGTSQNISHSLGVKPSMIIVKVRSGTTNDWSVAHKSLGDMSQSYIVLNSTAAKTSSPNLWNNTEPTSSVFSLGTTNAGNGNTYTYVAYLFAEIAGFSKFGSYTGNGSTDGPFVYCGFRPKYILGKMSSGVEIWFVYDAARNTYNVENLLLQPQSSAAESTDGGIDALSNGFKLRNSQASYNSNGSTFIYAAFAENPFKYSLAR